MNTKEVRHIYFLGIGGIGMSALARFFALKGAKVYGYDRTETKLTKELENEGMKIHYNDDISEIPSELDLCVYTPAVPKTNKEFDFFINSDTPFLKRSEMLGELTKNARTIGVAGTHGKTTISTMVAHLLYQSDIKCNAFLGGISKNYDTNFLLSKESDFMVVEADEFDRSFLRLFQ